MINKVRNNTGEDVFAVFRERLKQLRMRQVASRETISELCGLSSNTIRRYETGERTPDIVSLLKLADYFGVTTDYLLGRTEDPKQITQLGENIEKSVIR